MLHFTWVVFQEWLCMQVTELLVCVNLGWLSICVIFSASILMPFFPFATLFDLPCCVCFRGAVYGRCLESETGLRG